jgi:recombinational DNA repair protein RecT
LTVYATAARATRCAKKYGKEKDHPWTTHYEEMALKTAIRRLCKTLPKSPELAQALAAGGRAQRRREGQAQNIDMKAAAPLFTMKDVLKLVNKGSYQEARDLGRSWRRPTVSHRSRRSSQSNVARGSLR